MRYDDYFKDWQELIEKEAEQAQISPEGKYEKTTLVHLQLDKRNVNYLNMVNGVLRSLNQKNELVKRKSNFVQGIIVNGNLSNNTTYYLFRAVVCTTKVDSNEIVA